MIYLSSILQISQLGLFTFNRLTDIDYYQGINWDIQGPPGSNGV